MTPARLAQSLASPAPLPRPPFGRHRVDLGRGEVRDDRTATIPFSTAGAPGPGPKPAETIPRAPAAT